MTEALTLDTPLGPMTLRARDGAIVSLDWEDGARTGSTLLLDRAAAQLDDYFAGRRRDFDLKLAPAGTAFQRAVWNLMNLIPYGATRTYGDLAARLETSPRPVGMACGRNPIPIIIPCHRVVGANGRLTGYSGGDGVDTKALLLRLEAG